ncbi:polyphenol oxidase family protein [Synechococcus sp. CCY 9618]|uniref:polyphenol oxidase family protein n=1 Tax=Synechococcus sp. CCY 9618 TaxID=2815602 RepID=UPI001C23EE30|nr:polyphenol oxidase family protein [Synechococcus sp. CCY 9618]
MAEGLDPPFDRTDAGFNDLPGWTWVGTYGGHYLQCDLLAGFEHGFFTRRWQGREPDELAGAISAGISVHRTRQVHGATVLAAAAAATPPWPEADGLRSDGGGQSLWVCGADCTPVLIADPATGRVAACHAGWRGVAARIVPAAIDALVAEGARRDRLLVALGPAVDGSRYQVQRSVTLQVAASLGSLGDIEAALADLEACGSLLPDPQPGRDRLDIRRATVWQLRREGITVDRMALCPLCTVAEPLLFHSWRRDGVRAVQWSGVVSQA